MGDKRVGYIRIFIAAFTAGLFLSLSIRHGDGAPFGFIIGRNREAHIQKIRQDVISGRTALKGEGVRIIIRDAEKQAGDGTDANRLLVHERHLLYLVNELMAAGAEGISINGERIITTSTIRCVGPAIRINDADTVPPYEIKAIGKSGVLKGAIMMMGGVVDSLSSQGSTVEVTEEKNIVLEPYRGKFEVKVAKPAWKQQSR